MRLKIIIFANKQQEIGLALLSFLYKWHVFKNRIAYVESFNNLT